MFINNQNKGVYVLRHAPKDAAGELTEEGKEMAREMRTSLPAFTLVISSDSPRTKETAFLLTGRESTIDTRAGYMMVDSAIMDKLNAEAATHPQGFTGAFLAMPTITLGADAKAQELKQLIDETLTRLQDGERALIVSHDITMVPSQQAFGSQLAFEPVLTFPYLSGYVVDEGGRVERFSGMI